MNPSNRNPALEFDLNDFRTQIVQMQKIGAVKDFMGKIPGLRRMAASWDGFVADTEVPRIRGIIDGMTVQERINPNLIDMSRRRRIATGAGVDPADVSSLVRQFDAMAYVVKQMAAMSMMEKLKMMLGLNTRFRTGRRPSWAKPGESGDRDDDGASPVRR